MIAPDDVDALVLAAGRGERLGLGPKALLALGGRTLVERAAAVARSVARRVIVGAPPEDVERVRRLCGPDALVVPGGATRRQTMLGILRESDAPVVLVLDVVHPFVTPELARQVADVARRRGAAVAAVASASTVYWREDAGGLERLPPGAAWMSRKPFAFRRGVLLDGLERYPDPVDDAGLLDILKAAGQELELVPSEPWNIKVTTPDDWRLAEAIERGLRPA